MRKSSLVGAALAAIFVVASASVSEAADQTSWTRYVGACHSTVGKVSFTKPADNCYTNEGTTRDSYLRSSGSDVYAYPNGYFLGNATGSPNTNYVYNRMSITIRLCYAENYILTNRTISPGTYQVPQTGGLMSWRGPDCIND